MEKYSPNKKFLLMTRNQVRAFDSWAINELGIQGVVLMENAGRSCAELISQKLAEVSEPKVCIFCGRGNNGGDGYVVARHLLNIGFKVTVVICGDRNKVSRLSAKIPCFSSKTPKDTPCPKKLSQNLSFFAGRM